MLTAVHSTKHVWKQTWSAKQLGLLALMSLSLAGCAGLVGSNGTKTPPPVPLSITNVQASAATTSGFQVSWTTNAPADSAVDYGTTASYGTTAPLNSALVTSHQMALTGLKTGTMYHFRVRSTDGSGNAVSSADMTDATAGDTVAPTVSVTSPAANATISGTVNVTATASDNIGVASVQFKVDGANSGAAITNAPYALSLNTATLSNGNHVLTAVAADGAGNSAASAAVTVKVNNTTPDTTPPTVSLTAPANGATVSGAASVTANATDNVSVASVQFQLDNANVGSALVASPFVFSWDTTKTSNGAHTLRAIAKDGAGNSATSTAVSVTVSNSTPDTTPPTVSISAPASGATVSGTVTVSANASDNVGVASVQFKLDGANLGSLDTASPYTTSWNTTTASNGTHMLSAVAKDAAGNTTTSASLSVTVNNGPADTTPPTVSITAPASGATVSGTVTVSANASDNVGVTSVQFRVDGNNAGAAVTASPYAISLNTASFANGSHALTAVAKDAAGNSTTSSAVTVNVSNATGSLPQGLGWFDIPNTQMQSVCPAATSSYNFSFLCQSVVRAWSGGIGDTKRNRLILWGGGHNDYYGNELYSFDLTTLKMTRLNNPSPLADGTSCPTTLSDGKPNSRHTYAGLAYIAHADKMWAYSGGLANIDGCNQHDTWTLDMATLQWTRMDPTNGGTPNPQGMAGASAAYDSVSKLVYLQDRSAFWSYNYDTNTYQQLNSTGSSLHINSVVDPKRRLFITVGGPNDNNNGPSLLVINIGTGSNYALQDWTNSVSGCGALISSASPGLQYDPVLDRIVGWPDFGNTVYLFNPDTKSCTTQTYAGGPADSAQQGPAPDSSGTYGRFQYFPSLGVYAVVNDWNIDAHVLRLSNSTGTTPAIAISGVASSNITTNAATISWTTNVGGTSRVEYGTSTSYGQSSTTDSNLVLSHQQTLTGLTANTLYHYRVHSLDTNSVEAISSDFAVMTASNGDTTPPTVSVTAPANGAAVSGTVTVSATAADNVGVASVQFFVDGASVSAKLTTAPYSTSWNSATATNGSHTITAVALDAAGNSATSTGVSVTVSGGGSTSGVNTFANRSQGVNVPGGLSSIVSSQGFETAIPSCTPTSPPCDTYQKGVQAYITRYRANSPAWDCTTAAEGGCSLKFVVQPGSFQGDSGAYDYNFSPDLSRTFGAGQEFFIQYQTKWPAALFSSGALTNDDGLKHDITTEGDSLTGQADDCSNSPAEIVSISSVASFFGPIMYANCGYSGGQYAFMQSGYQDMQLPGLPGPNYLDQNAAGCPHYSGRGVPISDPTCYLYQPNEWFTIQKHIKVGAFGSPNSVLEMWVAHAASPAVLVSNASDAAIPNSGTGKGSNRYGKIQLSTYDTGATWNFSGQINFDNLIVATRRIPDPNVGAPNAPDSLSMAVSTGHITVSWRVNSQNGTGQDDAGFIVERCSDIAAMCIANPGSGFTVKGTTPAGASSFVDNTTVAGTTYTYRVRATNSSGNSSYTVAVCFNGPRTCGGTAIAQ